MADKFTGAKAFLNIPVGIARDEELLKKPKSILLMGEIISTLNVTGEFYMSNKKLAERINCTPRAVQRYLELLEKRGYIKRKLIYSQENKKQVIGRSIYRVSKL